MSDRNFRLTPFASCAGRLDKKTNKFETNDVTEVARCCLNFCEPQISYCRNRCKNNLKDVFKKELDNPDIKEKVGWFGEDVKNWNIKDSENLNYYDFNSGWSDRKIDRKDFSSEGLFSSPDIINKRCLKSCKVLRDTCLGQCRLVDPLTSAFNIYNNCAMKFNTDKNSDFLNLDDEGVNSPSKASVLKNKKEIMKCCLDNCKEKTTNFDCDNYCTFLQNLIIKPTEISPSYAKISKPFLPVKLNLKRYKDYSLKWILLGIFLGLILVSIIIYILIKNN